MSGEQHGWRVDVKHEITDPWEEWGWYSDMLCAKKAAEGVPYKRARIVAAVATRGWPTHDSAWPNHAGGRAPKGRAS